MGKYSDIFSGAIKKFKDSNLKTAQTENIDYFILNDKDSNGLDLYYIFTVNSKLIDLEWKKDKKIYIKLPDSDINLTVMPIEWIDDYFKKLNYDMLRDEF